VDGKFITLEGGEGAGKSTHAAQLTSWLHEQGIAVVQTREPGGTPGADAIRGLLLDSDVSLTAMAEAHLFAAARADHIEKLIRPTLAKGEWVVCDRFVDSSIVYQGIAGGLSAETVRSINETAVGDTWPDLTLYLRTGAGEGARRAMKRDGGETDRFSARDLAFHGAVALGFDRLAAAEPERFAVIDAEQPLDTVAETVCDTVRMRLL
jgi:dTMP kinase